MIFFIKCLWLRPCPYLSGAISKIPLEMDLVFNFFSYESVEPNGNTRAYLMNALGLLVGIATLCVSSAWVSPPHRNGCPARHARRDVDLYRLTQGPVRDL